MSRLYGISPVHQCLTHRGRELRELFVREGKPSPRLRELLDLARAANVSVRSVSVQDLADRVQTRHHQGVVLECGELLTREPDAWLDELGDGPAFVVALDQIEDPQNLGGIVRSAAFLGASAVITLKTRSSPLSPAASKASAGALEYFPVIQAGNLSETLVRFREANFFVFGAAVEEEEIDYRTTTATPRMVLVMGNEGTGLRKLTRKRCDQLVHIPGRPHTESLNVNVATAVLMNHYLNP